jgi:hypothetical protein
LDALATLAFCAALLLTVACFGLASVRPRQQKPKAQPPPPEPATQLPQETETPQLALPIPLWDFKTYKVWKEPTPTGHCAHVLVEFAADQIQFFEEHPETYDWALLRDDYWGNTLIRVRDCIERPGVWRAYHYRHHTARGYYDGVIPAGTEVSPCISMETSRVCRKRQAPNRAAAARSGCAGRYCDAQEPGGLIRVQ